MSYVCAVEQTYTPQTTRQSNGVEEILASHAQYLDEEIEKRLRVRLQSTVYDDIDVSAVEARGELCLTYMTHLERTVALLSEALKDKEIIIEQMTEKQFDARKSLAKAQEELIRTRDELAEEKEISKIQEQELMQEKLEHAKSRVIADKEEALKKCEMRHFADAKERFEQSLAELQGKLSCEIEKRCKAETLADMVHDALDMQLAANIVAEEELGSRCQDVDVEKQQALAKCTSAEMRLRQTKEELDRALMEKNQSEMLLRQLETENKILRAEKAKLVSVIAVREDAIKRLAVELESVEFQELTEITHQLQSAFHGLATCDARLSKKIRSHTRIEMLQAELTALRNEVDVCRIETGKIMEDVDVASRGVEDERCARMVRLEQELVHMRDEAARKILGRDCRTEKLEDQSRGLMGRKDTRRDSSASPADESASPFSLLQYMPHLASHHQSDARRANPMSNADESAASPSEAQDLETMADQLSQLDHVATPPPTPPVRLNLPAPRSPLVRPLQLGLRTALEADLQRTCMRKASGCLAAHECHSEDDCTRDWDRPQGVTWALEIASHLRGPRMRAMRRSRSADSLTPSPTMSRSPAAPVSPLDMSPDLAPLLSPPGLRRHSLLMGRMARVSPFVIRERANGMDEAASRRGVGEGGRELEEECSRIARPGGKGRGGWDSREAPACGLGGEVDFDADKRASAVAVSRKGMERRRPRKDY